MENIRKSTLGIFPNAYSYASKEVKYERYEVIIHDFLSEKNKIERKKFGIRDNVFNSRCVSTIISFTFDFFTLFSSATTIIRKQ